MVPVQPGENRSALFRKRLAEPCDDAQRRLLLKLLAEEEAKEPPAKGS